MRGATFAAALYDQLGSEYRDQDGTTINYQSNRVRCRCRAVHRQHRRLRRQRRRAKDDEVSQARKKGTPLNVKGIP